VVITLEVRIRITAAQPIERFIAEDDLVDPGHISAQGSGNAAAFIREATKAAKRGNKRRLPARLPWRYFWPEKELKNAPQMVVLNGSVARSLEYERDNTDSACRLLNCAAPAGQVLLVSAQRSRHEGINVRVAEIGKEHCVARFGTNTVARKENLYFCPKG
jgi:hypothetical protein